MPSGKVIFTGVYGPGLSLTTRTFDNLAGVNFDFVGGTVTMIPVSPAVPVEQITLAYAAITTFTATISGGVTTITLS